ncbi:MAG: PqqD family peptide modification chaperone [Acidimicrobiales bacterium]|nr:PqqD family peptide modification chaperone [Acidimicrobiales bacterium]
MSQETPSPLPEARSDVEVFETADGLVIYDPDGDRAHHLNPSASLIFFLCTGQVDHTEMARHLAGAFELDAPPLDEVAQCLATLRTEGLLR